ncbi:hypothetical protein PHY01_01420 [Pseudonocardia hydrocarbonoxydans]|uniref:ABC3 transporter permease C-terminal domain-containing protein n=1 Tax=Pseudonocardia hydrocarbonoxydans TaxID=76726 RepID=A0A4Y3WIZ0_9PSEU|nr:ABC transporter permease [Pseudonocardia hydrocarbonoxydans]GEC17859.1 hypothetical protein PHY01_01420 [Pseudonocardia hydrocarbonoxydans]
MPPILRWTRLELRRRRRGLLVLALLVALSCGAVLTAAAGARRGDSALDRLLGRTGAAHAIVNPFGPPGPPGSLPDARYWERVRALPIVEDVALVVDGNLAVDGLPSTVLPPWLPTADAGRGEVERPVVLAGRAADPARSDEAVVTAEFLRSSGRELGDVVTLRTYSPASVDAQATTGDPLPEQPDGPAVPVTIVGVVRSFAVADDLASPGLLIPSPAFAERYRSELVGTAATWRAGLVRLHDPADLETLRREVIRLSATGDVEFTDQLARAQRTSGVLDFESACLLALGLAAAAAAAVLVGQAVQRTVAATLPDLRVLGAAGMTRGQAVAAATAAPTVAALGGALLGAAGAAVASAGLPFGAAGRYEPAPGVDVDVAVLGGGVLVAIALVAATAAAAARLRHAGTARVVPAPAAARPSAVARVRLPVPAVLGARFALEPGGDPAGTGARASLAGAVVGVLGVLAAATFAAGVTDAVEHPERFGTDFALIGFFGLGTPADPRTAPAMLAAMGTDPAVTGVTAMVSGTATAGGVPLAVYGAQPVSGSAPGLVATSGRPPAAADEVLLGPVTARELDAAPGRVVELAGPAGPARLRVVGIGFLPQVDNLTGALVTAGGFAALGLEQTVRYSAVALAPGDDPAAAVPRLQAIGATVPGAEPIGLFPIGPPPQVQELATVQVLPRVLGVFLGVLAVGAVGHGLATAVRRRGHDLAVLRALGMSPRQTRTAVHTHAAVLAVAGLAVGVPLGIALGRTAWRTVAETTPIVHVPPAVPWALAVPAVLAATALLAALPARRAARLPLAELLRREG